MLNVVLRRAVVMSALLCCWLSSAALSSARAADSPGLKPGGEAPAFTLQDQNGRQRSLESLLKQGNVALVFFRSADW